MAKRDRKTYVEPPKDWEKGQKPAEKPKRSWRGFFIGMLVMLVLFLGVPLVVYLAALIYIKTGGIERAVDTAVKDTLGPDATVAAVETSGIESLRIKELTVPSTDGNATPAITVQSVKVLWDPYALAMNKQIRAVEVDKPSLALRRSAEGLWNFDYKSSDEPSDIWIQQIEVTNGTLGLEWAPGKRIDLSGLRVMMMRAQPPLPQPISVYAQWPSKSELRADAVLGPGSALRASLSGAVDLAGDLSTVGWPGEAPKGKVTYRFDARREWSVYTGTAGDVVFDGRVDLDAFRWAVTKDLALVAPDQRVELRARIPSLESGTLPDVEEILLNVEGLGKLSGNVRFVKPESSTASGQQAVFEKGQLRLKLDSIPKWFDGLNLLPGWKKQGEIVLEDTRIAVPLEDVNGLTYKTNVTLPELQLGIPGAGDLPLLKLKAAVSGSLKGAKIAGGEAEFGKIGSLVFGSDAKWTDLNGAWLELLKAVDVRSFDFDLGALLRTEVGRRLVTGRLGEGKAPVLEDLPVLASGRLQARDLKAATRTEGQVTTVSLAGVEARDLEIQRAPIPVNLAGLKLDGALSGEVKALGTKPQAIRLNGDVASTGRQPLVARFGLRMDANEKGELAVSGADVSLLKVPLAGLLDVFGLSKYLKCSGDLTITDGSYNAAERSAAGLLRFVKLNANQKGFRVEDLTGQARVTFKDGKLTAKGRFDPVQVALVLTARIPAMAWVVSAEMTKDGQWRQFAIDLSWENGEHFALSALLSQPAENAWRGIGRIETSFWGGLSGSYDATLDTGGFASADWGQWKLGPLVLKLEDFNLARLGETPLGGHLPAALKLGGTLSQLRLEASPFFLAELRTGRPRSTVVVRGAFAKGRVVYSPSKNELERSEAERLKGSFRGEVTFDAGSAGFACNILTTLSDYEMLLDPRYLVFLRSFKPNERFYIPPPKGKERLTAQFVGQIQPQQGGNLDVRLHKLLFDMQPRLRLSATGRLTVPSDWDLFDKGEGFLSELEVSSSDLAALNKELLQRNIGRRAPNLRLGGAFAYRGRHVWSTDRAALSGRLLFRNVDAANVGWSVTALNGTMPLAFHQGLWPGDWPREIRGTMTVGSVRRAPLYIPKQPLAIVAMPNEIALVNAVNATVTGGEVQLEGLRIQNILTGAPNIDFGFRVQALRFDDLAAAQGLTFKGLRGYGRNPPAVLQGLLSPCRLWREPGTLGTWNLMTQGSLTAPLFEGQLQITGLYGRDCLGLTPTLGVDEVTIKGMSVGSLTALNSVHGHVKVDVDVGLRDFEMQGLDISGVRRFRMEVRSIPKPDKEYFFERKFAQWLANEPIEKVTVGKKPLFKNLGWGMELKPFSESELSQNAALKTGDSWLYYMLPLLPDECILTGIRLEGMENAGVPDEKRRVKGKRDERILWRDVVKKWLKR